MTSIDRMSVERLAEYISPDVRRVMLAQADRIEELEAGLVKALELIALCRKRGVEVPHAEDPLLVLIDNITAKLKGQKP